jgi:hypothetical protein
MAARERHLMKPTLALLCLPELPSTVEVYFRLRRARLSTGRFELSPASVLTNYFISRSPGH